MRIDDWHLILAGGNIIIKDFSKMADKFIQTAETPQAVRETRINSNFQGSFKCPSKI